MKLIKSNRKPSIVFNGMIGGALDAALSSFPPSAIVWGAIKGGVNSIRTERAQAFVNYVENNFTIEMFKNEQFVDGVSITFEAFVKQRIENKRNSIKNIFKGFVDATDKERFELERLLDIVNKISLIQIQILSNLKNKDNVTLTKNNNFSEGITEEIFATFKSIEAYGLVVVHNYYEIKTEEETDEDGFQLTGHTFNILQNEEYVSLTDLGKQLLDYFEIL